jgi:multidrug efflux pump subunit AcrB
MWMVKVARSRPYTFVILVLLLFLVGPVMLLRTPVDIFPAINVPAVSIIWTYADMAPSEMETRITSNYERGLTSVVENAEHVESQTLNGVSVINVYLQPHSSVDRAIAEVMAEANSNRRQLPPGITPPLVIRYDASTVPILQIGLSGKVLSEQQLNDSATNFIGPQLATVPGAAVPIMTLGGLALAAGILVDDPTVEIENIERQLSTGKELRQAILDGAREIAVPAFVAALCISNVFVPMFFLNGVPRYLFVLLGEAVIFALWASYFFSRTIIPTMVQFLLRKEVEPHRDLDTHENRGRFTRFHDRFEHGFERVQQAYTELLHLCRDCRALFASSFLCFCLLSLRTP